MDTEYASYSTCIADGLKKIGVRTSPFYHFPPWTSDDVAEKMGVRQTWEAKRDSSVYTRIPETGPLSFYEWRSVELASPVFYTVEAAYSEIRKVCQHLETTYHVMVNSTCGLHIHIGNGSFAFPLRTLKPLMASLWTWEPQIHILHPALRTMPTFTFGKSLRHNGTHPLHALHCPPNTKFKDPTAPTNNETVQQIYKCKTKEDLIYWLANSGGYNAYKMENLLPVIRKDVQTEEEAAGQLTTSKRTIEFRQHEGTLDGDRIVNWAKLCIGFVDRARWVDPDVALHITLDQLDAEGANPDTAWTSGLEQMLIAFGGREVADYYINWLHENGEWLRKQVEKRKEYEAKHPKLEPELTKEEIERNYQAAIRDMERLDREMAVMEAQHIAEQERRAARLDEGLAKAEPETRGRSKAAKQCTATTNLSRGSAESKMKLLDRAAGDRVVGSKRL